MTKEEQEKAKLEKQAKLDKIKAMLSNNGVDKKVKNINEFKDLDDAQIENFNDDIKAKAKSSEQFDTTEEKMVANQIKASILEKDPDAYDRIKDFTYKDFVEGEHSAHSTHFVDGNFKINLKANVEDDLVATSFDLTPNSFWKNITNILNSVDVGNNKTSFGKSFNAFEYFLTGELSSGTAKLLTQGYPLSGINLLDQNLLVPSSTQVIPAYQTSGGVFINEADPSLVGGGKGIGLFAMWSAPQNVLKLAVTNPKQYGKMVNIFRQTALQTQRFTLWMIGNTTLLKNIQNFVFDNKNVNTRNCLNGSFFPAIERMKNPTDEFNLGLTTRYEEGGTPATITSTIFNFSDLETKGDLVTNIYKENVLKSPYLIGSSPKQGRINTSQTSDISIIVSPEFMVNFKSGVLSTLFHYGFQDFNEYIDAAKVFTLYKQVAIPAGYMNTPDASGNYPMNQLATLSNRFLPKNSIVVLTKPDDVNMWNAFFYMIWRTEMSNSWGAGMVDTHFNQFAFGGGVVPYSNGFIYHAKFLLQTYSDETQPTVIDNDLNIAQVVA